MTLELLLTLIAAFGAVALLTGLGVSAIFARTSVVRQRLASAGAANASSLVLAPPLVVGAPGQVVHRLSGLVPRSPADVSKLRRRFIKAGYQTAAPIAIYTVAQAALPLLFMAVPLYLMPLATGWPFVVIAFVAGFKLPSLVLQHLITVRQKQIRNGLPDALDLMIVCLEAGSSLDQTIVKVSDELGLVYPALAEELRMLVTETRAGKPRLEAFKNLAARTGVDDVRALVAMLAQTDRFGTSVSKALRTHADTARTKRRQRAEEAAAKIGVKLAFPLVFCLFPAFFIVTLGPAVIQFIRVFATQLVGR